MVQRFEQLPLLLSGQHETQSFWNLEKNRKKFQQDKKEFYLEIQTIK
jgi:hypothetical protein